MQTKNLVLGSVASLALAVAASSAFAQSPPQYPDYSLPWESAQTQQLNAQQASEPGVIVSTPATAAIVTPGTSAVVASTDNSGDVVAYDQALAANNQTLQAQQSQFSTEQSSYNSQLSDYQAKQSAYQQSWQDYQNKLARYNESISAYHDTALNGPVAGSVVSEQIISRPAAVAAPSAAIGQEVCTRPVVHEESFTRQVVRQQTITRPVVREETVTRPVVVNETVTRPVVTQETYSRPVQVASAAGEIVASVPAAPVVQDQWVTIYPRGYQRLVVVDTMSNADTSLRGAAVMDSTGSVVGSFRHMSMQDGIPEAVITLNDQKTVAVADQHLRYDPTANMIVADLTYNQLESMPARF